MQLATASAPVARFSSRAPVPNFDFSRSFRFQVAPAAEREIVHLVDDDARSREALAALIASFGRQVATFGSAREFLASRKTDSASCLVLEMFLSDMNGLDLQRRLADDHGPQIIFMSGRTDISATVRAMKAGAIEFLSKPVSAPALDAAIHLAFAQDRYERKRRAELTNLLQRYTLLTPREREVLPLLVAGLLNKQAAATLGISEITVQVHRGQIMRKMAAPSFADLIRMAEKLGIPEPVMAA